MFEAAIAHASSTRAEPERPGEFVAFPIGTTATAGLPPRLPRRGPISRPAGTTMRSSGLGGRSGGSLTRDRDLRAGRARQRGRLPPRPGSVLTRGRGHRPILPLHCRSCAPTPPPDVSIPTRLIPRAPRCAGARGPTRARSGARRAPYRVLRTAAGRGAAVRGCVATRASASTRGCPHVGAGRRLAASAAGAAGGERVDWPALPAQHPFRSPSAAPPASTATRP